MTSRLGKTYATGGCAAVIIVLVLNLAMLAGAVAILSYAVLYLHRHW